MEAGYFKGIDNLNALVLYASWKRLDGIDDGELLEPLNDNQWYDIMVWYKSQTNPRWIVKLDDAQVYSPTQNKPDFAEGAMVGCGAESDWNDTAIAVQCDQLRYRPAGGAGVWTLYDYNQTQTTAGYCVWRPWQFGLIGQGPLVC